MFSYMKRGKGFYRAVFALTLPMIVQNLVTSSLGMLDTFMVGMLGEGPMAAVTLANIPIFVEQIMTFGLMSGSSVLISQFHGKGDAASINRVLGIGLYLGGGLTLAFGCVMFFFPHQFMSLFGEDAAVVALAAKYIKIVAFSICFGGMGEVYTAAHRAMGRPTLGMALAVIAGVTNVFLNWVFIFGNLGAPALGVEGAALATLLSRTLQFAIAAVHAAVGRRFRLKPALVLRPGREMLARYIRIGTPVLLNETLWGLGFSMYTTIMGHMAGSQAILAAYAISGNIDKLCTVAVFAIANAAAILIGREIGAGRQREEVHAIGKALDALAFLVGLVSGLLFIAVTLILFQPLLYPLFSLSPQAEEMSTLMCVLSFAFLSLRSFNTTNVVGIIRGGGDVKTASAIDLAPLWLVSIPVAALVGLVFQWGILAVLLAIRLEDIIKFFLGLARLRSGKWVRDVTTDP